MLDTPMSDEKNYNVLTTESGVPIKAWTKGVQLEDQARKQLLNVAQLPFIFKWVAAMPDVHWGIGASRERDSNEGRDHPGCRGRGHRLRHDGGIDGPERARSSGKSERHSKRDRKGGSAWTHESRWARRCGRLAGNSCAQQ